MTELIKTKKPAVSSTLNCSNVKVFSVQSSVNGSGKVSAIVTLEGSLDGIGWFTIAEMEPKGEDYATDGGTFEALWSFVRAHVQDMTGDEVSVFLAKRG